MKFHSKLKFQIALCLQFAIWSGTTSFDTSDHNKHEDRIQTQIKSVGRFNNGIKELKQIHNDTKSYVFETSQFKTVNKTTETTTSSTPTDSNTEVIEAELTGTIEITGSLSSKDQTIPYNSSDTLRHLLLEKLLQTTTETPKNTKEPQSVIKEVYILSPQDTKPTNRKPAATEDYIEIQLKHKSDSDSNFHTIFSVPFNPHAKIEEDIGLEPKTENTPAYIYEPDDLFKKTRKDRPIQGNVFSNFITSKPNLLSDRGILDLFGNEESQKDMEVSERTEDEFVQDKYYSKPLNQLNTDLERNESPEIITHRVYSTEVQSSEEYPTEYQHFEYEDFEDKKSEHRIKKYIKRRHRHYPYTRKKLKRSRSKTNLHRF